MTATVHIVGAGLAGLSAAVRLTASGRSVVLHEATAFAGGRCRSYHDASLGMMIDNGNHLILSGNRAALEYLRRIGAEHRLAGPPAAEFSFVDLASGERWMLRFNDGRIPFWIFDPGRRVPGTRALDYAAMAPLLLAPAGKTVGEVIACEGTVYRRLVEPLLLAALNIDPPRGSARLAGAVIRETLALGGRACRPLVARGGLGATLIEPALAFLHERGAAVRMEHQLRSMRFGPERVEMLYFGSDNIALKADDAVILAVPPYAAAPLIDQLAMPTEFRAIVNAHFRIDPPPALPPILGVLNGDGGVDLRLSRPPVGHHQRRRSAHRYAAGRAGEGDLGRSRARDRPCRPRCRPGRSCANAAPPSPRRRRRTPSVRAPQPNGAISCSPAIGQIPACPLPSKARSDPAIAPPT